MQMAYRFISVIDLSKAFDTVNYNILLENLSMYGVKVNNLKWFHSYLSNRKQYIEFQNGDKKEKKFISY